MKIDIPFRFKPNIRFEKSGSTQGYIWGKTAHESRILATLVSSQENRPALNQCTDALGIKPNDIIAERWIGSDDYQFPSVALIQDQEVPFHQLLETHGELLLGEEHVDLFGAYLCTVMKLLDTNNASDKGGLSVQVHPPSGGYADRPAKPEMWKGEGEIYLGWNQDMTEDSIRNALFHEDKKLEQYLNKIQLKPEQPVFVPGGAVHAIRAGTFTAEWSKAPGRQEVANNQNLSHATVTLYDGTDGRPPRPGKEDIETALKIISYADALSASTKYHSRPSVFFKDGKGNTRQYLLRAPEIFVEEWRVGTSISISSRRRGYPLYVEKGEINLKFEGGSLYLRQGEEVFLPATLKHFQIERLGVNPAILQVWYIPFNRMPLKTIFTKPDVDHLTQYGLSVKDISDQIKIFRKGVQFANLDRPCTVDDGIKKLASTEFEKLISLHQNAAAAGRVQKFVPASGAASRMFQVLLDSLNQTNKTRDSASEPLGEDNPLVTEFFERLREFPFYGDLMAAAATQGLNDSALESKQNRGRILSLLLEADGLGYATLPKGLVKFHAYKTGSRTALEEHLVEAIHYACDATGTARVHFTVSLESETKIKSYLEAIKHHYESEAIRIEISYSNQERATDKIGVDQDNEPVREKNGRLHLRPGGHGALLQNLNDLQGDIVFIKNIDNVVPDAYKPQANHYKPILSGYLIALQKQIFQYIEQLTRGDVDEDSFSRMFEFVRSELLLSPSEEILGGSAEQKTGFLLKTFNRPIRVCGMVRNQGEPGGGPFWVNNSNFPLQIVESSQVNMRDDKQCSVWNASTHFNPVDIVCGVRDYRDKPFDLFDFCDKSSVFITEKFLYGKKLKALESPGLWNGSMAYWNTIFIEVPPVTFNPVKTVFDLLREVHRSNS